MNKIYTLFYILILTSFNLFSQGWITSVPIKLKEQVNSIYNDVSPLFYVDSTTLYFTRSTDGNIKDISIKIFGCQSKRK